MSQVSARLFMDKLAVVYRYYPARGSYQDALQNVRDAFWSDAGISPNDAFARGPHDEAIPLNNNAAEELFHRAETAIRDNPRIAESASVFGHPDYMVSRPHNPETLYSRLHSWLWKSKRRLAGKDDDTYDFTDN